MSTGATVARVGYRHRMRRVLAIGLLTWSVGSGCDAPPEIVGTATRIPQALQDGRFSASGPGPVTQLFVYGDSFADGTPGSPFGDAHLFVTRGHETSGGYVADEVVVGVLHDGLLRAYWTPSATCAGTASYADDAWTLALGDDPQCARWNGVYRDAEAARAPMIAAATAPVDAEPVLVLPPPTTPFARALAQLPSLRASEAPCPVALRVPAEELTTSDSPGEAALRHAGEATGEAFEVLHAVSGEALPSDRGSRLRYQALYVQTTHAAPSIDPGGSTFTPGRSRGRAFLVDVEREQVVCVGDVHAQNGPAITGGSEARAALWLTLQLALAEERAIATGLHAVAAP